MSAVYTLAFRFPIFLLNAMSIITYVYIYVIIDIFYIYITDLKFFISVMKLIGIFFCHENSL